MWDWLALLLVIKLWSKIGDGSNCNAERVCHTAMNPLLHLALLSALHLVSSEKKKRKNGPLIFLPISRIHLSQVVRRFSSLFWYEVLRSNPEIHEDWAWSWKCSFSQRSSVPGAPVSIIHFWVESHIGAWFKNDLLSMLSLRGMKSEKIYVNLY